VMGLLPEGIECLSKMLRRACGATVVERDLCSHDLFRWSRAVYLNLDFKF
jgi:hypothetical protein